MIPAVWQFALLALGTYRATRLVAWDTLPPLVRARGWLLGETFTEETSDAGDERWTVSYRRPLLAELFGCSFCLSFWVGLAVYLAWWAEPTATLVVCTVLALSAVTGLIAKNWDA